MKATIKSRLKYLFTGKLPKAVPFLSIAEHVRPYLTDPVQVGKETLYRVTEWAYKPITKDHPTFKGADGNPIKIWKAFTCGGIDYYTCDPGDLPSFRFRKWSMAQEEYALGLTSEFLDHFIQAVEDGFYNGSKRETEKAVQLLTEFKVRRQLVRTEDMMYKLISLVYFTEDEDLIDYNYHEQRPKIENWQKHREPADFFFDKRMMELLGLEIQSKDILADWLKNQKLIDQMLKRGLYSSFLSTLEPK